MRYGRPTLARGFQESLQEIFVAPDRRSPHRWMDRGPLRRALERQCRAKNGRLVIQTAGQQEADRHTGRESTLQCDPWMTGEIAHLNARAVRGRDEQIEPLEQRVHLTNQQRANAL